jgi:putative SOS response-associated peptidase YedK
MPVLLAPADWATWLDPGADPERLKALLRPAPEGFLAAHPVGPAVGSARNEGPGLLEPVDA